MLRKSITGVAAVGIIALVTSACGSSTPAANSSAPAPTSSAAADEFGGPQQLRVGVQLR